MFALHGPCAAAYRSAAMLAVGLIAKQQQAATTNTCLSLKTAA